ncbi:MAG TPA: hypothetical protein VD905_05880 [Flavobacteriales bacterium]|nr:hypothetical protein [Flavobacteriales bacterium]
MIFFKKTAGDGIFGSFSIAYKHVSGNSPEQNYDRKDIPTRLKTIIFISLLLSTFVSTYGQKKASIKIIGTWVGPSYERYDSIKSQNIIYQDTIVFFNDHKYRWTSQNQKEGTWQINSPTEPKDNYGLYLSGYNGVINLEQGKNAEQRHPFEIVKLTKRQLKFKTFISWDERNLIVWRNYEFTKI